MRATGLRRSLLAIVALGGAAAAQVTPSVTPAEIAPTPPDYAAAVNWAAQASAPGLSSTRVAGASRVERAPKVDVFYVHPTTDRSTARWNQDVTDAAVNRWTDASVIARQASIFNACCRVFAPRYRQATWGAAFAAPAIRDAAFAIAYGDVLRAFDAFLRRSTRPFILVGHSQGAAHLERLLQERIDGRPVQDRLVAAYVIGISLPEGAFGTIYKSLRPCDTPEQTGCVIHWNSMLDSGDATALLAQVASANAQRLGHAEGTRMLCVNPLTFNRARPAAAADAALGTVPGAPDAAAVAPLVRGVVAARCEDGLLRVRLSRDLALAPLPGGSMHFHDLGLFYENVRGNAVLRANTYLRTHAPRASILPSTEPSHEHAPA